jgi:hypothetical protein
LVGPPEGDAVLPLVQVEFVVPSGHREEERPTPVPGQRLLPPPPQLERNEFGVWEEFRNGGGISDRPPKPGDWMG